MVGGATSTSTGGSAWVVVVGGRGCGVGEGGRGDGCGGGDGARSPRLDFFGVASASLLPSPSGLEGAALGFVAVPTALGGLGALGGF